MAYLERLTSNPIFLLFTLLSLLTFINGLRLMSAIRLRWQELQSRTLQPWQKQLAERAAFLIAVPPGVFVHEFGHMLATWLFGGRVAEFGYGFYWGYILAAGEFSSGQDWFISLAGTMGTLVYGLGLWLALRHNRAAPLRYFGLRSLRFHLYYGLVYYPLFTLFTFIGDWRIIYDFESTPLLSGLTLPLHLASLGLFWLGDRRGWFEMQSFASEAELERLNQLEKRAKEAPHDVRSQLELIEAFRQGGATRKALRHAQNVLKGNPDFAEGHLQLAALYAQNKVQVPSRARHSAARALALGLSKPTGIAFAHQLLGQYELDVGRPDQAIDHLSQGLSALRPDASGQAGTAAHLTFLRALAYRRKGQYEAAYQDIQAAMGLARAGGNEKALAHYQTELETIELHAGRSLGASRFEQQDNG